METDIKEALTRMERIETEEMVSVHSMARDHAKALEEEVEARAVLEGQMERLEGRIEGEMEKLEEETSHAIEAMEEAIQKQAITLEEKLQAIQETLDAVTHLMHLE